MKIKKYNKNDIYEKYISFIDKDTIPDIRVGTDSQLHRNNIYKFSTIVCFHYNNSSRNYTGGDDRICILWESVSFEKRIHISSIKYKMMLETQKTLTTARELAEIIEKEHMIIELDINNLAEHPSNDALETCKGMCLSEGFTNVNWKPNAIITYAANKQSKVYVTKRNSKIISMEIEDEKI